MTVAGLLCLGIKRKFRRGYFLGSKRFLLDISPFDILGGSICRASVYRGLEARLSNG